MSNLKRVARLINSQALSGGGALESLIEERSRAGMRPSRMTSRESERIPESFTSLDQIAVAITHEFMVITNREMTFSQVSQRDTDNYTRIEIAMQFSSNEVPEHGDLTTNLSDLIEALTVFVATEKGRQRNSVHSVKYVLRQFTDAIVFIVKVNWKSYEGEDQLSFFDC